MDQGLTDQTNCCFVDLTGVTLADEDTYSEVVGVIVANVKQTGEENDLAATDLVTTWSWSWILILFLKQLFGSVVSLSMFAAGYIPTTYQPLDLNDETRCLIFTNFRGASRIFVSCLHKHPAVHCTFYSVPLLFNLYILRSPLL